MLQPHTPLHHTAPQAQERTDGIDLVYENDAGRLLLGQRKRVAHHLGAVTDEHLHQRRPSQLEEGGVGLGGARARHQRLARACMGSSARVDLVFIIC